MDDDDDCEREYRVPVPGGTWYRTVPGTVPGIIPGTVPVPGTFQLPVPGGTNRSRL